MNDKEFQEIKRRIQEEKKKEFQEIANRLWTYLIYVNLFLSVVIMIIGVLLLNLYLGIFGVIFYNLSCNKLEIKELEAKLDDSRKEK